MLEAKNNFIQKSSGGSNITARLIQNNKIMSLDVDIAGHTKNIHFTKAGLEKFISNLQELQSQMENVNLFN